MFVQQNPFVHTNSDKNIFLEGQSLTSQSSMASSLTRFRLHYLGNIRISRLAASLVFLLAVYATWRYTRAPSRGVIRYKNEAFVARMSDGEIKQYLGALQDTRPDKCPRHRQIRDTSDLSVSIVTNFYGEELFNLKLTLTAILENTPADLFSEIVVLDDGTENLQIRQHAAEFFHDPKFKNKIRAFRSEIMRGPSESRFKASHAAKGDILVFVDSSVVVNNGWLEPLLVGVRDKSNRFVVPHSDNFLPEKRFFKLDDQMVTTFSWLFSTVYKLSTSSDDYLPTPIMRGDVVAVKKQFLRQIGDYDEMITVGGGENLELSLRAWMCGGEIVTSTCSRVATHEALKPHETANPLVIRRITELWISKAYKELVYRQTNIHATFTDNEHQSNRQRKTQLKRLVQCRSFDWYLNTVASDTIVPTDDMKQYGKLMADAGFCPIAQGSKLIMDRCRPYLYSPDMMFEYTSKGNFRHGDQCLMADKLGARVVLAPCEADSVYQIWRFSLGKYKMDVFPGSCLIQMTEMDKNQKYSHYMILDMCRDNSYKKQFWSFLPY